VVFSETTCKNEGPRCESCLFRLFEDGYLIGIGAKHYKRPQDFLGEALTQGISKRIPSKDGLPMLPRGFQVGKSLVLLGHPEAIIEYESENGHGELKQTLESGFIPPGALTTLKVKKTPGIIAAFIPSRIEYICKGDETDEFIDTLVEKGITPVQVIREPQMAFEVETP